MLKLEHPFTMNGKVNMIINTQLTGYARIYVNNMLFSFRDVYSTKKSARTKLATKNHATVVLLSDPDYTEGVSRVFPKGYPVPNTGIEFQILWEKLFDKEGWIMTMTEKYVIAACIANILDSRKFIQDYNHAHKDPNMAQYDEYVEEQSRMPLGKQERELVKKEMAKKYGAKSSELFLNYLEDVRGLKKIFPQYFEQPITSYV